MTALAFFTTSLLRKRERFVLRGGTWCKTALRVRVGYLHHPTLGHTLIDTGYSRQVTVPGLIKDRHLAIYRALLRPNILSPEPLAGGLARFGVTAEQIESVILTHFHADHVAGLTALPNARVICSKVGWEAINRKSAFRSAREGVFPTLLPDGFLDRAVWIEGAPEAPAPLGLEHGFDLANDGSVLAVALPGHLDGHFGLCFPHLPGPFLYAADVQWMTRAILEDRCPGPPASWVHQDQNATRISVARVRRFAEMGGDILLCHEPGLHAYDVDPEVG